MSTKYVYFFGEGKAEGDATMRDLLGGKGANLAEMTNLGIPVPPGFTISTQACAEYSDGGGKWPASLEAEVKEHLARLEKTLGAEFGSTENPLLVSVRSGAAVSMPGMMDTVLNLGLTPDAVEGLVKRTGNERFAWDSYRRFINMFGDVVRGVPHEEFERILSGMKVERGVKLDTDLGVDDLKLLVEQYLNLYEEKTGEKFPEKPWEQLVQSINAVFGSWGNPRAIKYRKLNDIRGLIGTAVNVQSMVFGNMGDNSATGVAFTRDPATGADEFYGEYLINAQGEDVVAGIRTPEPIAKLEKVMGPIYQELVDVKNRLEQHYKDVQDIEFTIQDGKLYLLQTRSGKRTSAAAVKIASDMVQEGMIDKKTALLRLNPSQIDQFLHPTFDPKAERQVIGKGLAASPGAATGKVYFHAEDAEIAGQRGEKVILVRRETSPEDIGGMHASKGILTAHGGSTSHAAVVARGMGKCCVAGCDALNIEDGAKKATLGGATIHEGDYISLDGSTGEVMLGQVPTVEPELPDDLLTMLSWADDVRRLKVRANADTPEDATRAREFGAQGIGLCRTEHMFFDEDRIKAVREMILSDTTEAREKALAKLLPEQRKDFEGIFEAMDGLPVTIRLLDPPLHEFLPFEDKNQAEMAKVMGVDVQVVKDKVSQLHETNPMLGHRGCRLGVTHPEIYDMQVRAILEAAKTVAKSGKKVIAEIMIPLVGTEKELSFLRKRAENLHQEIAPDLDVLIGTMIEVPRAALTADEVAKHADFFSFGTNDLTQMALGLSRDDTGLLLEHYVNHELYERDPFVSIDVDGVGQLVRMACEKGRKTKPDLKLGICGEHGGDPASIAFCEEVGLDYVSCSPFRVPIARLAAAQAVLKKG